MNPPSYEIVPAQSAEERQQCYDVRIAVFHHEQNFPLETEIDEFEDISAHFLLRLMPSLTPAGTIRGYQKPGAHHYKLSRLAVLKDYRHLQLGRALVDTLHTWARAHALSTGAPGPVEIVAHSQIPVKGFYAKFGYIPEGAEFDEDGDPHQKMVLHLSL